MIPRLPLLFGHEGRHLPEADGAVVVTVHTDIEGEAVGIIPEGSMGMAIEMPGTEMSTIPYPHGIMAEIDQLPLDLHLGDVMDGGKGLELVGLETVVVADRQVDLAVEFLEIFLRIAPAEIPDMMDNVARLHNTVPIVDQSLVVFRNVTSLSAGPVGMMLQDAGVTQMTVCCKPMCHIQQDVLSGRKSQVNSKLAIEFIAILPL